MRALFNQNDAQVIAVCDPVEEIAAGGGGWQAVGKIGRGPLKAECEKRYAEKTSNYKCNAYEDFRVLLEKEKSIDACLVATPVHNQALLTISAMKAGKHVYCEKPLAHNVWEVRQVAKVAKETGVATQMGNQGHSTQRPPRRQRVDRRRSDRSDPRGPRLDRYRQLDPAFRPAGAHLRSARGLQLGPLARRPRVSGRTARNMRRSTGGPGSPLAAGSLADMGCHNMDVAVTALKLVAPISVEAEAPRVDDEVASSQAKYVWRFGPRGDMPPVTLTWWDGSKPQCRFRRGSTLMTRTSDWAERTAKGRFLSAKRAASPAKASPARPRSCLWNWAAATSGLRTPCRAFRIRTTTPIGSRPARAASRPAATSQSGQC